MNHNLQLKCTATVLNADGTVAFTKNCNPQYNRRSTISIKVRNSDGTVASKRTIPMKSFVRIFMRAFQGRFFSTGLITSEFDVVADAADDTHGLQIGTDSTAPAATDTTLTAKISHGSDSGEMSYGVSLVGACAVDGANYKFVLTRSFTNVSGNSITIKEAGAVFKSGGFQPYDYYLIAHDLLNGSTGEVIADGQTIDLVFTIYMANDSGLTQQFLKLLRVDFADGSNDALTDTTGASITSVSPFTGYKQLSANGDDSYGVVIGTSDAAVDATLYCLGAKLLTADFIHQVYEYVAATTVGNTTSLVSKRTFTNISGAPVTVEEAGIYGYGKGPGHYVMLARTLTGGIVVGDSQSIQISYTFEVTT